MKFAAEAALTEKPFPGTRNQDLVLGRHKGNVAFFGWPASSGIWLLPGAAKSYGLE